MAHLLEDKTREELLALCKRWETAHCSIGVCGSEYYADPERTFAAIRSQRDSAHKMILKLTLERKRHNG